MRRASHASLAEGRYSIHERIAAGGMATVHLGRLVGPGGFARVVAIKKLHAQFALDPDFSAAFLDEALITARIRHPNVVPMLDVVSTGEELLLVMEYLEGEALWGLFRAAESRGTHLPPPILASIVVGMLRGLHAAHEVRDDRGEPLHLVHRDVSPHNVLVGCDGLARVIDFGVAKALGRSRATAAGSVKGKLAYMAPEQLAGGLVTRRTDVFAAAIVLWEGLTGQRLFASDSEGETVAKIRDMQVEPPSRVAPWAPPELDDVVLRGLARMPEHRFDTAEDMAGAIERAVTPASAQAVGKLVAELAAEPLRERAQLAARVQRASETTSEGPARELEKPLAGDAPDTPDAPRHKKSTVVTASMPAHVVSRPRAGRGGAVAIVVAALAVGAGFAALLMHRGSASGASPAPEAVPATTTTQPPPAAPPPSAAPEASVVPVATSVASATTPAPPAMSHAPPTVGKPPGKRPTGTERPLYSRQ